MRPKRGEYQSEIVWAAALDLCEKPTSGALVSQHESKLRALREHRARKLFEVGVYWFHPAWGRVVESAVDAIARRHGWKQSTTRSYWYAIYKWLEQKRESSENDYFEARSTSFEELHDAYVGLRHIHKWRERHPGTPAVAQACEFSKHTEQALRTWLESLDAPAARIEGAQAEQMYNRDRWALQR